MTKSEKHFFKSWWFLMDHKIFSYTYPGHRLKESHFSDRALHVFVTTIDPRLKAINEKDESKNTQLEFWLECGPLDKTHSKEFGQPIFTHDTDLDCGGRTFEEAIIKLAKLVRRKYGV